MAAQQENLAHGGGINLPPRPTPLNEPYINVGSPTLGGGRSLSPSAYPVQEGMIGQPRIAGQYTENIQRVPEARSAAEDFLKLAEQRRIELEQARAALAAHRASGGDGIPVALANQIKQDIGIKLGASKFGQRSDQEAFNDQIQKSIRAGLREGVQDAVPEVGPINAKMGDYLNAIKVAERRAELEGNKNIGGLTFFSHSPTTALGFMADRSAAFKALLARGMNSGQSQIPATVARLGIAGADFANSPYSAGDIHASLQDMIDAAVQEKIQSRQK
jgi:hypothetical protein